MKNTRIKYNDFLCYIYLSIYIIISPITIPMKTVLCLGLLLTIAVGSRDLQSDIYQPFSEEELNKIRSTERTQPSESYDPFTKSRSEKK